MNNIEQWHHCVHNNMEGLNQLLDKQAVFYSPILFKAQEGRHKTSTYLQAAFKMFTAGNNNTFKYVRELNTNTDSVLEFECTIDGIVINGVDMIKWNEQGKITEFKVMLRPKKANDLVSQKMLEILENTTASDKAKYAIGAFIDKLKK